MQVDRIGEGPNASPNQMDDLRDQRIVLTHVLSLHTEIHLTVPGLVQEISAGDVGFEEGDSIDRAIRDLTGIGLLNCPGGLVVPSHAAVRFNALLGG
jgi:hypothetical protein